MPGDKIHQEINSYKRVCVYGLWLRRMQRVTQHTRFMLKLFEIIACLLILNLEYIEGLRHLKSSLNSKFDLR